MAKGGRRMRSGPRGLPKEIKVLRGTFRADKDGELPTVKPEWPAPPNHLNDRELDIWRDLQGKCAAWVTPSDAWALNGFAQIADQILRCQEEQRQAAQDSTEAPKGDETLINRQLKLWRELRAYIGLLGLSPADRARVHPVNAEREERPLDRFIKGVKA